MPPTAAAAQGGGSSRKGPGDVQCPEVVVEPYTAPDGTERTRRYIKGRMLGKGGFAVCYALKEIDGEHVAGKVVPKATLEKARSRQKLRGEIRIHRTMSHPHIVRFMRYFEDPVNVYMVMELCSPQTMADLLKKKKVLSEGETAHYVEQILSAMQYMHKRRIIHRDLKLGNLFLSNTGEIKIGDFGLACRLEYEGERKKTICGTPNYIAPEVLNNRAGHSFEVDVWSLGVILYTLMVGRPPFETNDVKSTYKRIRGGEYCFPATCGLSDTARDLIARSLQQDPVLRPTLDEIAAHPFLRRHSLPPAVPPPTPSPVRGPPPARSPGSAGAPPGGLPDIGRSPGKAAADAGYGAAGPGAAARGGEREREPLRPLAYDANTGTLQRARAASARAAASAAFTAAPAAGEATGWSRAGDVHSGAAAAMANATAAAATAAAAAAVSYGKPPLTPPAAAEAKPAWEEKAFAGSPATPGPGPLTPEAAADEAAADAGAARGEPRPRGHRLDASPLTPPPPSPGAETSPAPAPAPAAAARGLGGEAAARGAESSPMTSVATKADQLVGRIERLTNMVAAEAEAGGARAEAWLRDSGAAAGVAGDAGAGDTHRRRVSAPAGAEDGVGEACERGAHERAGATYPPRAAGGGAPPPRASEPLAGTCDGLGAGSWAGAGAGAGAGAARADIDFPRLADLLPSARDSRDGSVTAPEAPAPSAPAAAAGPLAGPGGGLAVPPPSAAPEEDLPDEMGAAGAAEVAEVAGPGAGGEDDAEDNANLTVLHDQLQQSFAAHDGAAGAGAGARGGDPSRSIFGQRGKSSRVDVGARSGRGDIQSALDAAAAAAVAAPHSAAAEGAGAGAGADSSPPALWVCKWVDYSNKYGLGYTLSDGSVGVLFNDASKLVLSPGRTCYQYIERKRSGGGARGSVGSSGGGGHAQAEERQLHSTTEPVPEGLQKKVTLLWHFESYLRDHVKGPAVRARSGSAREEERAVREGRPREHTYLKKWLKTRHAIIFRLSNKTIQVNFNDATEIVLSSEVRTVTYVNKQLHRATYPLSSLPNSPELLKRLKYTKEVLFQLISRSR